MPAPTPIQIRYGDNGLLGQAAAYAGNGAGLVDFYHNQQAQRNAGMSRDMQFINDQMDRQQQADQFAQSQQLQANQLQQAAQMRQPAQPDSGGYYVNTPPLGESMKQMRLATVDTMAGGTGLTPEQQDQLRTFAGRENVPMNDITNLATNMVHAANKEATKKAKSTYLDSVASTLPASEVDSLRSLATADNISPEELRVAVDNVKARTASQQHQQTSMQVSGVDEQIRMMSSQAKALADNLRKQGYDPEGAPDQFNPSYADPNAARYNTMGFKGAIRDAVTGGGSLVKGGDPDAVKTYEAYVRAKNALATLSQQRQKLATGMGGTPINPLQAPSPAAASQQQTANPVASMSDADLLKALQQ